MQHNSMMMNQGGGLDPEYATINTTTTTTTTITNTTTSFTTSFLSTSAYFAPSQAQQQQQQQQQQLAHVRNDENSFVDDIFPFEDNAVCCF
jgi:hypothetical protein